jgi:hypothetical protein
VGEIVVPFFRNLFAIINQPTAWSFLTGRNAGSGYCEDWKYPQRETVAFCIFGNLRPSADALGLGLGLGGPWVAQAWPKGHPSVAQGRPKHRLKETALFATKDKKMAAGVVIWAEERRQRAEEIAKIAKIAGIATIENRPA